MQTLCNLLELTHRYYAYSLPQGRHPDLPIEFHQDGSAFIRVTPSRLGKVKLDLWGQFPDGGIVRTSLMLNVELPSRSPEKIIVGELGLPATNLPYAVAYLSPRKKKYALEVSAQYGDVSALIPIDADLAKFEVRTANDASIIELDESTGLFKPLQVGEALVETTFGGWTNFTCVLVKERPDLGITDSQDCKSLLLPGEKLATPIRNGNSQ